MNPIYLTLIATVGYAVIAAAVTGIRGATTPPRVDKFGHVEDKHLIVTGAFWPVSVVIWAWNRLAHFFYWLSIWAKEAHFSVTGEEEPRDTTPQPEVRYIPTGYVPDYHTEEYEPEVHAIQDEIPESPLAL